jgi:hypothetical protein
MRSVFRATLLTCVVIAMPALLAPAATAVGVNDEASGEPCSAISNTHHGTGTGGCQEHFTSSSKVELAFSIGMILCDLEMSYRTDGSGQIYAYHIVFSNCEGGTVVPCSEAGVVDNWVGQHTSETSLELTSCVTAFGFINSVCHQPAITVTQAAHDSIELSSSHTTKCEGSTTQSLEGSLSSEVDANHPPIEIVD